jgi:hypothetical protein
MPLGAHQRAVRPGPTSSTGTRPAGPGFPAVSGGGYPGWRGRDLAVPVNG